MNSTLAADGYMIHRRVFPADLVEQLRSEADRVATAAGTACVRHLAGRSEDFRRLATDPRLLALLPVGLAPVRSMLFDKTPTENWPVRWHQDLTVAVARRLDVEGYGPWSVKDGAVHVQPPVVLLERMATVRIHLDETPAANGALRVIPGSHRLGKLLSAEVADHVGPTAVTCECGPGDVLVMSPLILHSSSRSRAPGRRRVIHFEYAPPGELDARLEWHEQPLSSPPG